MVQSDGYTLDIPYLSIYHGLISPLRQSHALLSVATAAPEVVNGGFTYLELGCGPGSSLLVHAAANPKAQFIGVDFNPEHIAAARALVEKAGMKNVTLLEASFADIDPARIPDLDFIAAHGIWSWVSAENRGHIKRLVDAKLKKGGVFFVSYNAMPGCNSIAALRELLRFKAVGPQSSLLARVEASLAFAQRVCDAKALFFNYNPVALGRLEQIKNDFRIYLAHEYFVDHWTPFYHSEVAADLQPCGLRFAGSVRFSDNVDQWHFPKDALALIDSIHDDAERETLKDYFLNRTFRTDLFTRGAADLSLGDMVKTLMATRFALVILPSDYKDMKLETELGVVRPSGASYQAFVDALGQGPATPAEAAKAAGMGDLQPKAMFDMLVFLSAIGAIVPALPPEGAAERKAVTDAFNGALVALAAEGADFPALVSPLIGGGVAVKFNAQLFLAAEHGGKPPVPFAMEVRKKLQAEKNIYGAPWQDQKNSEADIKADYDAFMARPRLILKQLGVAD